MKAPLKSPIKQPQKPITVASTKKQNADHALGKRTHREVIDDFEGVYMTYKRARRNR